MAALFAAPPNPFLNIDFNNLTAPNIFLTARMDPNIKSGIIIKPRLMIINIPPRMASPLNISFLICLKVSVSPDIFA